MNLTTALSSQDCDYVRGDEDESAKFANLSVQEEVLMMSRTHAAVIAEVREYHVFSTPSYTFYQLTQH